MVNVDINSSVEVVNFVDEQATREIVTIQTAIELVVGQQYKISMSFVSTLNSDLRGFYRSSYMEDGVRK